MNACRLFLAWILLVLTFSVAGFSQKKQETKPISHTVTIVNDFKSDFDWQNLWLGDLKAIGVEATVIAADQADAARLSGADVVLWNCGNDTAMNTLNRAALATYLDSGGQLLLVAPRLPAQLFKTGDHSWLKTRLGCDYVMENSSITWSSTYLGLSLSGYEHSILKGIKFGLTFGPKADVAADNITLVHSIDERATHLVRLKEVPGYLGVARETPNDRTILLTFPLESVRPTSARRAILGRCLKWLTRPRYEGRGIWIVRNRLTSPGAIDTIVNACADANFNTLFVQVRGRGDAFYKSATEPRASELAVQPESFDPLQYFIEKAHTRGLQVHAWLNAGFVWGSDALPTDPKHILNRHPEYVMVNRSGKSMMDYTGEEFASVAESGRYLSLAAPAVQDYLTGVYLEVVKKYNVDGIHFDFIRYPARGVQIDFDPDYNPLVVAAFKAKHGFDPRSVEIDSGPFQVWLEWQRQRIGQLVGRIHDGAHALRPGVRVSAAVLSKYYLGRHQALQDWVGWLRLRRLDAVCLMSYGADNDLVVQEGLLAQENRGAGSVWVGMSARGNIDLIIDRIAKVRRTVAPEGILFFAWGGFDRDELAKLRTQPFAASAKVPPVHSK
ncbi:MAG: family 10 glycosylhydrolase [Ignavibacteria bacterium]|nr:family 10 glycosylhydrolase [Ignavibacteria bacterium]